MKIHKKINFIIYDIFIVIFCLIMLFNTSSINNSFLTANAFSFVENSEALITFESSFDDSNLEIASWRFEKKSLINTSQRAVFEDFVKQKLGSKYSLLCAMDIAVKRNNAYIETIDKISSITLKMSYSGKVTSDECAVLYVSTTYNQETLMSFNDNEIRDFLNSVQTSDLSLAPCKANIGEQNTLKLEINTKKDGVFILFKIENTGINTDNLFFLMGIIICVIILVLLVIMINYNHRKKALAILQEKINNNLQLRAKLNANNIDGETVQKQNMTRKVENTKKTVPKISPKNKPLGQNTIPKALPNQSPKSLPNNKPPTGFPKPLPNNKPPTEFPKPLPNNRPPTGFPKPNSTNLTTTTQINTNNGEEK